MKLNQEILSILRCPFCGADVESTDAALRCVGRACQALFPLVEGAPVLINDRRSLFDTADFLKRKPTFFKPIGRLRKWISSCAPDLSTNVAAKANFQRLRDLLAENRHRSRVLVVGGGVVGAGMEALTRDPGIDLIETDVSLGSRTQLICDAHDLPFKDSSVDAVIVQAVLEHVVDPFQCVDELHRVLKPGGLVYSDTPFIQQVHGREYDFTRFTLLGHRRLFRKFTEVASGITCGPAMALAWTLRYFFMSFFASPLLRSMASGLARAAFFWLKYLDYYLVRQAGAADAASAFYFLGRKSRQVLSDRDLVAGYRGGF